MATGARGEGFLTIDGEQVPILFTLRALAEAEGVLNKSVTELLRGAMERNLGIGDTAQLLRIGLEHARQDRGGRYNSYTMREVWQILDQLGFAAVAIVVLEAISAVLSFSTEKAEDEGDADHNPPVE